jgi:hypothetical protein
MPMSTYILKTQAHQLNIMQPYRMSTYILKTHKCIIVSAQQYRMNTYILETCKWYCCISFALCSPESEHIHPEDIAMALVSLHNLTGYMIITYTLSTMPLLHQLNILQPYRMITYQLRTQISPMCHHNITQRCRKITYSLRTHRCHQGQLANRQPCQQAHTSWEDGNIANKGDQCINVISRRHRL